MVDDSLYKIFTLCNSSILKFIANDLEQEYGVHYGYHCVINRPGFFANMGVGWGNGYVEIGGSHPLFEKNDSEIRNIDIHGGLTFAEYSLNKKWVFGFDTAHYGDTLENCPKEYVWEQTINLARQLREIEDNFNKN